jgi:hypothetical protein
MKNGYRKDGKNKAKSGALRLIISGIFCAFLMLSAAAFSVAADSKPEKIIFLTLNYKDNVLTVKDISWGKGFVPSFSESLLADNIGLEKASLEIYSENEISYSSYFYVDNKRFQDSIDEKTGEITGGLVELNDVDFTVIAPYLKKISYIKIHSSCNDIVLKHESIDKAKEIKIPSFGKNSDNGINENEINETDGNSDQEKSLFLEFVGIMDSVYHYIFG